MFDQYTLADLGSVPIANIVGTPIRLLRCGADRLAFTTTGGQLFLLRTSLARADNDRDGLPDDWETEYFGSINAPSGAPNEDFDGDGLTNLQEFLAGLDPTDPTNLLRIVSVQWSEGTAMLEFHAVAGCRYQLLRSATLGGPWSPVGQVMTGQGMRVTVTDTQSASNHCVFYRLRQEP